MQHDLQWFENKESVFMILPAGKKVPADIKNKNEAKYYFDLQIKGFLFEEVLL